jgi:hypothetical protein
VGFGVPYYIGRATGSATSEVISVGTATTAGDVIFVALANSSSGGATITGITDSAGNDYARIIPAANTSNEFGDLWAALPQNNSGTTGALTTSNTITVTWSATTGQKMCVAFGLSGVAASSAVDQDPAPGHATNASPTVSTGTLAQAAEMAIGVLNNAVTAAPSSVGLTQLTQQQATTSPYITVCYELTSSTSAVTFSGSFGGSENWCAMLVTLLPAASVTAEPVPYLTQNGGMF